MLPVLMFGFRTSLLMLLCKSILPTSTGLFVCCRRCRIHHRVAAPFNSLGLFRSEQYAPFAHVLGAGDSLY